VGVVTDLSVEEHTLTVLTDEDESVGYGFDELTSWRTRTRSPSTGPRAASIPP
jgi:hypothetical protein